MLNYEYELIHFGYSNHPQKPDFLYVTSNFFSEKSNINVGLNDVERDFG
ncbi:hypothetical protein SAMN05660445_00602 [Salegentibacter salarius]|nr:hypothetical protein SAMN05660445_00602 [Salegentibacter salarius]